LIEVDSVLRNFLPELVGLLTYGHSLLEKLVRFNDFAASQTPVNDSKPGATLKAVVRAFG
jgi:hypothetical protein